MKVLILGAAGKTGTLVIDEALKAGHEVTALVHHASDLTRSDVKILEGDATDAVAIATAVQGQDAVLDTIGGKTPFLATDLESSVAKSVIDAMQQYRVRRLIVTSMVGVGDSKANATFYERLLIATFLRGADRDKAAMEDTIVKSKLDWIILRPALLTDDPGGSQVRVFPAGAGEAVHAISRADLAAFMVAQLSTNENLHQAVTIAAS